MLKGKQRRTAIEMIAKGATVKEVAKTIGISYRNGYAHSQLKSSGVNVREIRNAAGIGQSRWPGELDKIRGLIREGYTTKEIAKRYKVTFDQMSRVIYKSGISIRRERYEAQKEDLANALS